MDSLSVSLLRNYDDIKFWSKKLDQDSMSFYSPNDFEYALIDYSYLSSKEHYKKYSQDFNWFVFEKPSLYTYSLDAYASYLTYVIIIQMYENRDFTVSSYEAYFTQQLLGFLEFKKDFEKLKNFILIKGYWEKAFSFIEYIVNTTSQYKKLVSNSAFYFNCNKKDNYKVNVPLIGLKENSSIDCVLLLPFTDKKPSWYSVPTLYKMYTYFANQDITIDNVYIYWFDLNSFKSKPIVEVIPTTKNVAELISRYKDMQPFPYRNIFNKNNKEYFNKTPVSLLLK